MVFSELIFLSFFLPLLIISYFLCKNRIYRNVVLLLFSLLFYAWGEPIYLFLMLGVVLVAYLGGLLIDKFKDKKALRKKVFIITVCLIVSNLLFFKYTNFFLDNLGLLFKRDFSLGEIILPIGISFYTFQILSYVIDLYWGNIGLQKKLFLFIALSVILSPAYCRSYCQIQYCWIWNIKQTGKFEWICCRRKKIYCGLGKKSYNS